MCGFGCVRDKFLIQSFYAKYIHFLQSRFKSCECIQTTAKEEKIKLNVKIYKNR